MNNWKDDKCLVCGKEHGKNMPCPETQPTSNITKLPKKPCPIIERAIRRAKERNW